MEPLPDTQQDVPSIDADSFLREALGVLVETAAPYLVVEDEQGTPIGTLSMNAITRAGAPVER